MGHSVRAANDPHGALHYVGAAVAYIMGLPGRTDILLSLFLTLMSGLMANPKWIQIVNAEAVRKAKQNLQVSSALHRSISRSIKSMGEISQQIRETFSSSSVMDSFYSNLEASDKETKELSDILGSTYGEEAEEAAPSLADYDIGG